MSAIESDTHLPKQAYLRLLLQQSGVALCYLFLSKIVLGYYSANGMVTVLWPASGIALAAILLGGKRYWIGIFAGSLCVELWVAGHPLFESLPIATSAVLEALLGAWLLKRSGVFDPELSTARDFFQLIFAGLVAPSVCALTGVTVLVLAGDISQSEYLSSLAHWWMGETLGIVLVTSTILVWRKPATGWLENRRALEVASILGLTLLISQIIFLDWLYDIFGTINRGYWVYVVVTLGAVRLGRHGVLAILWIILIEALLGAANGSGFFKNDLARTQLSNLWFYTAILTVVGMSLATLIKERLQIARNLSESESTYRSLFENMMNSVVHARIIFDNDKPVDLEYITTNPAFAVITGITESVTGRRISEVIPGYCVNNPESLETFGRVAKTGVPTQWEHYLRELDRWFYFNIYSPARGEVFIITNDITANKNAEAALRKRDRYQRALLDNFPFMVWLKDTDSRILAANKVYAKVANVDDTDDLVGMTDLDYWEPALAEHYRADDQEVLRSGRSKMVEELITEAGRRFWIETYKSPVYLDGQIIGTVGFARDISERKEAEEQLRKLSLAVEQSPDSIAITNLDANIEYVNEAFLRNTGYNRDEVIGKNPRILHSGKTPRSTYEALWKNLTEGKTYQGEFYNKRKDGSEYIEHVIISPIRQTDGRITHYLAIKEDITQKKHAEAEIHRLAFFDTLTGLPNRALLLNRLEHTLATTRRTGNLSALISFNIDRFKTINDAGGHLMGDALIRAVGERLSHILRDGDVVARIAGDEFGIQLTNLSPQLQTAANYALHVSKKLHEIMHQPFGIGENHVTLSASLGISLFPEGDKDTPLDILRRANTSLHHSKSRGGAQTSFYESTLDEIARKRFDIERELQHAIESGELRVYLQPQVEASGNTVGAEALVRWQHPQRGLIPPSAFIPIAEESNLIIGIGVWVFTEVSRLLAREDIAALPLRISVNISPRHFHQPDFVDQIKSMLAATGADPTHITLEVTEGVVIDNINDVVAKMSELSSMGIHFSMDDFGTGYSSLSYLKRLPIHELKIDKSFIQDVTTDANDAGLVEAILSVAKHLHLKVVAEGVETAEQAAFLNQRATVIHQGYYFGKPEQSEKFFERLGKQQLPGNV